MDIKTFTASSALMATLALTMPCFASTTPTAQTTEFVKQASTGNQFEIDSSKLAIKRASSSDVKSFAQMMIADHTQIGDQLKKTLATSGNGLSPATTLSGDTKKNFDELNATSTIAFDNTYVQQQGKAHDDTVNLFTKYAQNGDDPALKKFASDELPVLKKHQDMVHGLTQAYMSTSTSK